MYQIDKDNNDLIKIPEKQFKQLGFRERDHLQEWIAKNPEVFEEELLIIQKEFSGFNDTNERLDLLALDKEGSLVVIENKLDDSGRDVTCQVLKYTSYCSTLSTNQIIRIYQQYLDKNQIGEVAADSIMDFLGLEDANELLLNDQDQRMILVANEFRKEVTSTVLWMFDHGIKIQCFRATPYEINDQVFLKFEMIIPLPETKELFIHAQEKALERKEKSDAFHERKRRLTQFWSSFKEYLEDKQFNYLQNVTPRGEYSFGFFQGKGKYSFCIGKHRLRVELFFRADEDKALFDALALQKNDIHKAFGEELVWERLEGKKATRIKYEIPDEVFANLGSTTRDESVWPALFDWYHESMDRFYKALSSYI